MGEEKNDREVWGGYQRILPERFDQDKDYQQRQRNVNIIYVRHSRCVQRGISPEEELNVEEKLILI